jgi:hypothetical protein
MDDLVVAIDGRLKHPDHPGQGFDRHLYSGAEPPGLGNYDSFNHEKSLLARRVFLSGRRKA